MKKVRWTQLLALTGLIILVACGRQTAAPSTPSAPPPDTPTAEPTATEPASRGGDASGESSQTAATPSTAEAAVQVEEGQGIIYETAFEARPDGFSFRNYGAGYPEGAFTINELRALFGDGVCSRSDVDGEECVPSPEAQQWIIDRNADMRAGHCIGFTVTSYEFAAGELQPEEYTPGAVTPYRIEQNVPIMRTIAGNGSLYWVDSVWSSEVAGTPRDIIDALIKLQEPVDLSIFLPGLAGGHSLLAYGLEEVRPEQYHILVYDNNYPGEDHFVEVDYAANTWRYSQGAVNPDEAPIPYEGDAETQTLRFIPLSAYNTATCPFCPPADPEVEADPKPILVSVLGQGKVLVKTALGTISLAAGKIVNELPGASLILHRGQLLGTDTPDILLPPGTDYTLEFSGLERVSSLSPDLSAAVDGVDPEAEQNRLTVDPATQGVTYEAGGPQSPALNVTLRQEQTTYTVSLIGVELDDGQGLQVGQTENGQGVELRTQEVGLQDATMLITRQSEEGEAVFATTELNIEEGGGVTLDVQNWDGEGSVDQYSDDDGDGTYEEEPADLENQPLDEVIQQSDPETAATIVQTVRPVLGKESLESILAGIPVDDLTGREIGEILRPLNLTDEQLIDYLSTLDLPLPELAELLFALRLEPERLDAVIAGLELDEADEAELRIYLDDLALYQRILADWTFLNTEDPIALALLLNTYELTPAQLGVFLPQVGLGEDALPQVIANLNLTFDDMAAVAEALGVELPPTPTPTPTPESLLTGVLTGTATITATMTLTPTMTPTPTATPEITGTLTLTATLAPDDVTPTPDPGPGELPTPTGTPDPYPYPAPTRPGDPYPGPEASPTPDHDSRAFCDGDDLRIIAKEPLWREALLEIWSGEEQLLASGETGPELEPYEVTFAGPATWENLIILSSIEPFEIKLGDRTCPLAEE